MSTFFARELARREPPPRSWTQTWAQTLRKACRKSLAAMTKAQNTQNRKKNEFK
jgi:hypothetical protein